MSSLPISSVFNDGYVAEQYELFRRDPASLDESWRQFFRFAESLAGTPDGSISSDPELLRKVAAAAALVESIVRSGHLAVELDPLGAPPPGAPELTPEFHGITEQDLERIPGSALGFADHATAADAVRRLREVYCTRLGIEAWYLSDESERDWFRQQLQGGDAVRPLANEEKKAILQRLSEVDGLERFLARAYVGAKRFSIEGTDSLVPLLDAAIEEAGKAGAREVVMAMAHRGRLNVLAHVMGKPYGTIFNEFEGKHAEGDAGHTGDVKYHLGYRAQRTLADGREVALELVPNPSHLEIANAVLQGVARAHQRVAGAAPGTRDSAVVMPVVMHGDSAFPGEGIVPETMNLAQLAGYTVGGTLHVIVNNQVGFTTDPIDARSTRYASDMARGFEIPVVHVNADDAEAVIMAVRLGVAYRTRFGKDFLIDLIGYRRWGHNEGDEPTFTQPTLYEKVRAHPTPREVWGARLVQDGVLAQEEVDRIEKEAFGKLEAAHAADRPVESHDAHGDSGASGDASAGTAVSAEDLIAINEALLTWPAGFAPHQRLARQLERRRDGLHAEGGIDWGHAEALSFGSLVRDGVSIRISGQDAERGTFSHRHAVLHDVTNGGTFAPLAHLPGAEASFEVYNSALSEMAVLGFEYGYSVAAPDSLTIWEAQFGDFANGCQTVIDQYLVSSEAKWQKMSGLVLLLPHGYEGQGPEHSSARLERFLQLCADDNIFVTNITTAANLFHALRRQLLLPFRIPLVNMSPKANLRHPRAFSPVADFTSGGFKEVIDDPNISAPAKVKRVLLCSGKIYFDLSEKQLSEKRTDVAIVRLEQLYPLPATQLQALRERYKKAEWVWVQEEPKNMGALSFLKLHLADDFPLRFISRKPMAASATGFSKLHAKEQQEIIERAFGSL